MMKKILSILAVLVLCASLTAAAFATPSVTNPLAPEIVPVTDPDGMPAAGVIKGPNGEIIGYVYYNPCLIVTPVADAETSEDISDEAKEQLLEIYEKLQSGEMTLPYDILDGDVNPNQMVIRDLFDVSFLCSEHPEMLEEGENYLEVTFQLGVEGDEDVYAMVYGDGEWKRVVTNNNGDGSVTCGFDSVGVVVFCVEEGASVEPPVQTGDPMGENLVLWISVAAFSCIAVALLTVAYVRIRKKEG